MNSKWSMTVVCAGLAVVAAKAPAQERVTEVTATELTLQEPLESGGVAAVGTPEMMTYQGFAEKAGVAINNQSMVVVLRAFPTAVGGAQQGVTVTRSLSPAEVYKGSFAIEFDAALLALPDNADETYLEVAICSPDPCIPVALAPRSLVAHAALAASARSLQGAAYATDLGALMVAGNGDNAGILRAQADVSGVTQELRLDAQAATVAVARQDNTPTALKMRTSTADRSFELSLDNLTGDMMLTRVEPSATAAVRTITSALGLNHYFRVTDSAGPAPLSLESWSPDGGKTYMLLNDGAKEITHGGVYAASSTAGVTPPPKLLQVSLAGPGVAVAAFSGPNAAAFDFKYGAQSALRVGEDPAAAGQAMMLVGPQGLFLSDTALATDQNAAAAVTTGVKFSVVPFLNEIAQGETALAAAPTLQIQSVSNSVATALMKIDGDTGMATVYGPIHAEKLIAGYPEAAAANTAGPTPLFATLEYVPPVAAGGSTAGPTPAAELQLKVNDGVQDHLVARWMGRAGFPPDVQFVNAPNYISGSPENYITPGIFGATIVGGGSGVGNLSHRPSHPLLCPTPPCSNYCTSPDAPCWSSANRVLVGGGAIVAGDGNEVTTGSFIGGGASNQAGTPGVNYSVIGGGLYNTVGGSRGVIGGGEANLAGQFAFVGGGERNAATGNFATVSGGQNNSATPGWSTVGGGGDNQATARGATVAGGEGNTASGGWSTVPGGTGNTAGGTVSFAAGLRAKIRDAAATGDDDGDQGTFMWADATNADFTSDGPNKFLVRAAGGTTFYSSGDLTAGVTLASGGGSWSSVSDKNLKENFADIDKEALLQKLSAIPVTTWNYKSQDSSIRHIGPMGQDFHAAFGVGETETRLSTIDADGVALAAIQGLYEIVQEKDCEVEELRSEIEDLKELVKALSAQNRGGR